MKEIKLINDVKMIVRRYSLVVNKIPFNILLAASDLFYRENFHSQVLAFIFSNSQDSISEFIHYINKCNGKLIKESNYKMVNVLTEDGRIDILIYDKQSKHCIIIENKINDARDMERQLPRYIEYMHKQDYIVDALIYYSLDGRKEIDDSSWTMQDKKMVSEMNLVRIAAVGNSDSLVLGFLKPLITGRRQFSEICFYSQYIELLEYLGRNEMKNESMNEFYDKILVSDNYEIAVGIKNMIYNLNTYRRDRIREKYANYKGPFQRIDIYSNNVTLFRLIPKLTDQNIKLDINCNDDNTQIIFWIQEPQINSDLIGKILTDINEIRSFEKCESNKYIKTLAFPKEESKLDECLSLLLKKLEEYVNK